MDMVGFIGLGRMGSAMAGNIQKAGYPTAVHDVREAVAMLLLQGGAEQETIRLRLSSRRTWPGFRCGSPTREGKTMTAPSTPLATLRFFYGWAILSACFLSSMAVSGTSMAFGVFIPPLGLDPVLDHSQRVDEIEFRGRWPMR